MYLSKINGHDNDISSFLLVLVVKLSTIICSIVFNIISTIYDQIMLKYEFLNFVIWVISVSSHVTEIHQSASSIDLSKVNNIQSRVKTNVHHLPNITHINCYSLLQCLRVPTMPVLEYS